MSVSQPTVSIIIAAPPEQETLASFESLKQSDSIKKPIEIFIARGRMPSLQRNIAAAQARGRWLYFLDDDSVVNEKTLGQLDAWCERQDADVVGGPNICPDSASFLQSVFAVLLGSFLTFGPSRSRYVTTGTVRRSNEKELILCNLLIRKQAFEKGGKFDESLYPNEENALMESIANNGGQLWHDPFFFVWRYPRRSLAAFFRMLFRYGRGRAQQFMKYPSAGSLLNMAPSFFWGYLTCVMVWMWMQGGDGLSNTTSQLVLMPIYFYALALILQTIMNIPRFRLVQSGLAMVLMPFCHLFYGVGFVAGLAGGMTPSTQGQSGVKEVALEKWELIDGTLNRSDP